MKLKTASTPTIAAFLESKSTHTLALYRHFIDNFQQFAPITLHATKTMIGIRNGNRNVAWITALGKNFVHVVFPFAQRYDDNLCFIKIAAVPGTAQYNHHFRMLATADVTEEVIGFMKLSLQA
jgi:hypothetical protein